MGSIGIVHSLATMGTLTGVSASGRVLSKPSRYDSLALPRGRTEGNRAMFPLELNLGTIPSGAPPTVLWYMGIGSRSNTDSALGG